MDDALPRRALLGATLGLLLGQFLYALNGTVVGVAVPRMVADLGGLRDYAWVTTAYLVGSTTVVPIAGRLGDLIGRKWFLLAGIIGFIGTTALCGIAHSMLELTALRALQGIFGGTLLATVQASISDVYAPATRAKLQGLFSGVWTLSALIGPTVGGLVTEWFGWRAVFFANVPIALAAFICIRAWLPGHASRIRARDIDFLGAAALGVALVPVLVLLAAPRDGVVSANASALAAMSLIGLVLLVGAERRHPRPIIPFPLFRERTLWVAVSVGALSAVALFGISMFAPLVYQGVLGLSVSSSGPLLTPMQLATFAVGILTGQIMVRARSYRFIGTLGLSCVLIGVIMVSGVTPLSSPLDVLRGLILVGVGFGCVNPLYPVAAISALPDDLRGVVSSQFTFWRNVGATTGVALLGGLMSTRLVSALSEEATQRGFSAVVREQLLASVDSGSGLFTPLDTGSVLASQIEAAERAALSTAIHDALLVAAIPVGVSIIVSVLMPAVVLRARSLRQSDSRSTG